MKLEPLSIGQLVRHNNHPILRNVFHDIARAIPAQTLQDLNWSGGDWSGDWASQEWSGGDWTGGDWSGGDWSGGDWSGDRS